MSIFENTKNDLKQILPPPANSFMREINILKEELSQQRSELSKLHEENRKLLDELRGIREEDRKLLNELKRAEQEKINSILQQSNACRRKADENIWANVFNNTITDSTWLKMQTFSPGRWALGYAALYVLYRILNGVKPKHILELGLGQSTNMITQYAASNSEIEHIVVEHDPDWIRFYKEEYPISNQTEIVHLDRTFVPYKEAESVRVFGSFKERFAGKQFDFILIDAPLGSDMKQFARIDILSVLPECLSESFTILFDDTGRPGEANTVKEICSTLDSAEIKYEKGTYSGEKTCTVICSTDNAFLCTL